MNYPIRYDYGIGYEVWHDRVRFYFIGWSIDYRFRQSNAVD